MGIPGINGDGPRDVPEERQPLPGESSKPFLQWRDFLLSDASLDVRGHALRLRQTANAERWAPELVKSRAVVLQLLTSRLGKVEPSIPIGWFRRVRANGRLDIGGYDYYLGVTWRNQMLELHFDATHGCLDSQKAVRPPHVCTPRADQN